VSTIILNAEQEQEAQRVSEILRGKIAGDPSQLVRLLVSKKDSEIFGSTEFELRDRVHLLGAKALETVLEERKKKRGTKGQA
jgi:hypothetical protein